MARSIFTQARRKWREWESVFLRRPWLRPPDIAALPSSSVLSNNKPHRRRDGCALGITASLPLSSDKGVQPRTAPHSPGYSPGTFPAWLLMKMWTLTLFGKYCFQNCFYFLLRFPSREINNFPVIIFTSKLPGYSVLHYIAHRRA